LDLHYRDPRSNYNADDTEGIIIAFLLALSLSLSVATRKRVCRRRIAVGSLALVVLRGVPVLLCDQSLTVKIFDTDLK